MTLTITLLGHATLKLEIDGSHVVVDPFLAPNNPAATRDAQSLKADTILVTHGHGDHVADLVALAKTTGAKVLANVEIAGWLGRQGYDGAHAMNTGGSVTLPFGRVKMTPALHSSGLPDGSYGGDPGGFLITTQNHTIYIAGDTALFSDMSLIARGGIDIAILPIGDNFTMGVEDSVLALEYLKPKIVIPYHYNTWPLIEVDVDAWVNDVRTKSTAKPVLLTIDEPHTF